MESIIGMAKDTGFCIIIVVAVILTALGAAFVIRMGY